MDNATQFLQQLIQINSYGDHEDQVAQVLKQRFEAAGIAVKLIPLTPTRVNVVAEFGEGPDILAFTGHEDVVSPGDLAAWSHPPFAAEIDGDKLYGRGASDMKGGLAAMALAFIALKQSGFNHHMRFLATVDEEYGASGSRQLTKLGYSKDISGMIAGEPTGGDIRYGSAGSYNYEVDSIGKAAHSSLPALGINATTKLIDFALAERTAFEDAPVDPDIGPLVHSVTILKAGDQVNTIPDHAHLEGNLRPTPSFDGAAVTTRLKEVVEKINAAGPGQLTFTLQNDFTYLLTDKNSRLVKAAQAGSKDVRGQSAALSLSHGTTDASDFSQVAHKFDAIIYGPGNEAGNVSHQIDEYVSLTRYHQAIEEYQAIAKHYFA